MNPKIREIIKTVVTEKFHDEPVVVEKTFIKKEKTGVIKVEEVIKNTETTERVVMTTIINKKTGKHVVADIRPFVIKKTETTETVESETKEL